MYRYLVVFLAAGLVATAAQAGRRAVLLEGYDALVPAGSSTTLVAKLERRGLFRRDLPGRTVTFRAGGEVLGSAVTDDEGEARLQWTPPGIGEHVVSLEFEGDEGYEPGQGDMLCAARDPTRTLVVLDIDHTLSHTQKRNVIRGKTDCLPLEGADRVVARLAETADIVYVSARDDRFRDVTRRWLVRWGFPRNPVFLLDWEAYPGYDEAAYKIDTLTRIRAAFPHMPLGVGDKDSDAEAYRSFGMRALILGDAGDVDGAEEVPDWDEIERRLFPDGRGVRFERLHE